MNWFHYLRIFALILAGQVTLMSPALAQDGMHLQVLANASQKTSTAIDLRELDQLEQVSFSTTTIWTDGEIAFSGVPLKALLEHVGAEGSSIELIALNDYAVSMPISELEDEYPIVATRMDGKTMSVRDKGPYWVVFPYDADPKYRTETMFSRSIWQLNRLRVIESE